MTDFFERAQPVFDLYEQGNYAEALRLAEDLALEFPDRRLHTSYWRLCLLAVSGRKEEALQVMAEAVANGLWWAEGRLRDEPDVKDLQGDPEFERLISICAQRQAAAKGSAKPELLILEPGASGQAPHPLLLVFHGRDGSAEREKHHWQLARHLGWLTVLAQSSQIGSLNSYVWDDLEIAQGEIREHFKTLQEKHKLDAGRIVLGGFSQGSTIALLAALRGDILATAFIAVAPGRIVNPDDLPALAESARGRGLHGVIVAGGRDPRVDMFARISETLSSQGVPCQLEVWPNLGHAYPPDFQELLETTLRSMQEKEQE